ncbi:hypothetical protein BVC80_7333g7 [Macleaya cordata]|uniref:Uncharacterized protein n=1 Tax=Macleaya cordata TaxID=56857 RepID=A0A200R0Q2_MACCD|nr:hypothetical protein BVC80_7333g7 [Macleaya cordata]
MAACNQRTIDYDLLRLMYNRLVERMRKTPTLAKMVIALWMLLEDLAFDDVIKTIYESVNSTVEAIIDDTIPCFNCMDPINGEEPTSVDDIPFLGRILDQPLSRRFFYFNRDSFLNRVIQNMDIISSVVLEDKTAKEVHDRDPVVAPVVRASDDQGASSTSNPSGKQFLVGEKSTSQLQDQKYNEYPLNREEIDHFFASKWGRPMGEDFIMECTSGVRILNKE